MEALFGVVGKDFVAITADKLNVKSIMIVKSDESKICNLNDNIVMAYSGEPGDTINFAEYIQRNVQLYGITNGIPLSTKAAAHFTRKELSESLRSRKPYQVNLLIGGYNEMDGPQLYWMDYLGAMQKMNFAGHGYANFFNISLMDRHYKPDMTREEVFDLFRKCYKELQTRFIVNFKDYVVKVIDKDGVKEYTL